MSRTQIKLRIDSNWLLPQGIALESATLNPGEIGVLSAGPHLEMRSGTGENVEFDRSPPLFLGRPGGVPLSAIAPEGSGLAEQTLFSWNGSGFVAEAQPIPFASIQSGVVVYDDSEDEFGVVVDAVVPTALDGGIYTDTFVPPSFTSTIVIGAPL